MESRLSPRNSDQVFNSAPDVNMQMYSNSDLSKMTPLNFKTNVYTFNGIGYKVFSSHTEYIFRITAANGVSFNISDRYSSLRSFYEVTRKYI